MNLGFLFSGHDNLSSTDDDPDEEDLSGSEAEFSAGEIEEARVRSMNPSDLISAGHLKSTPFD